LFVTVGDRHLPTADRDMNHRLSRQTRHQYPAARAAHGRPASGRAIPRSALSGGPVPESGGHCPVMADGQVTGSPGRCARVPS
jgi:hypothetical protein